jgi:hypothetical protein
LGASRTEPDLLMEKKSKGRAGAATESLGTAARRSTRYRVLLCHQGHKPAAQEPALLLLFFKGDQQVISSPISFSPLSLSLSKEQRKSQLYMLVQIRFC